MKDGWEAWTEGPRGRVASYGVCHLGTLTSASVHGGDRVDQVKTAGERVEREGSGGLGVQAIEDKVARVGGGCAGVRYS